MTTDVDKTEDLGLEAAWLEDRPETILEARAYLEEHNFVVHVSTEVEEAENWVLRNGYDVLLTDLRFEESDRDGPDLIRELKSSEKSILTVPVSAYLSEYCKPLNEIWPGLYERGIDKARLDRPDGPESLRRALLEYAKGGRIRVIERCPGFVEEELDDEIVVCVKLGDQVAEKRVFPKERLYEAAVGEPSRFLEIVTAERYRGGGMVLQTICRWLHEQD